jgi:hypothetical protein
MYRAARAPIAYFEGMGPSDPLRRAQQLRATAERYLRLAPGTDDRTHDAMVMYAGELLDRAQEIEEAVGSHESLTSESRLTA